MKSKYDKPDQTVEISEEELSRLREIERAYRELCDAGSSDDRFRVMQEHQDRIADNLQRTLEETTEERDTYITAFLAMRHSFSWRITAPIRAVSDFLQKHVLKYRCFSVMAKGLSSLFHVGLRATWQKMSIRRRTRKLLHNRAKKTQLTKKRAAYESEFHFARNIKISIVCPLYNTPQNFLNEMIKSVRAQTYAGWELCLADGSDGDHAYVGETVMKYAETDPRIRYHKLEQNGGISENTNAAIDLATGEYLGLLDHDDLLHPSALFDVMTVINEQYADFIYTDESTFNKVPKDAYLPHYKPDYAIDNLRANNYICHFSVFSRELMDKSGRFCSDYDGSQDYDMILRLTENARKIVHIPRILYFWRAHEHSTAQDIGAKPYVIDAAHRAIEAHLNRCHIDARVINAAVPSTYHIIYHVRGTPKISILIPNMDHIDLLDMCLQSIYRKSTYPNFEIVIVENNSHEDKTFRYYNRIQKEYDNLRVVYWTKEFNFSAINNFGAAYCTGEYLLLLNNDIEIITPDWMEQMLMYAARGDVGAVGAMLYYPDNTIQHAGVIIGLGGVAGHAHKNLPRGSFGYMGRAAYAQNFSAVTAACLLMPRHVFDEIGGLDEGYQVAFNDVDMCLRIREKGYLIVFTPYAEAYHHESKSRGLEDTPAKIRRFQSEITRFQSRWEDFLKRGDPYYNVNLTLEGEGFTER